MPDTTGEKVILGGTGCLSASVSDVRLLAKSVELEHHQVPLTTSGKPHIEAKTMHNNRAKSRLRIIVGLTVIAVVGMVLLLYNGDALLVPDGKPILDDDSRKLKASKVVSTIDAPQPASQLHFKGMELCSWKPTGKDWHFSLLPGRNWRPPVSEVTKPEDTIIGVSKLKQRLSKLPKSENVFCRNLAEEPVPESIKGELKQHSETIGINLHLPTK